MRIDSLENPVRSILSIRVREKTYHIRARNDRETTATKRCKTVKCRASNHRKEIRTVYAVDSPCRAVKNRKWNMVDRTHTTVKGDNEGYDQETLRCMSQKDGVTSGIQSTHKEGQGDTNASSDTEGNKRRSYLPSPTEGGEHYASNQGTPI